MVAVLRRLGGWLRDVWLMVGLAAAALVLLEAGLTLLFHIDDRHTWTPPDQRFTADTYGGAQWPYDYYLELALIPTHWKPYVYWQRAPYHGRLINVEEDGLRRTTPSAAEPSAPKIFMFGGSTMWGTGARDEFTIPSWLAEELRRHGVAADVKNFGESGYVSSQSVDVLERELRAGHRPDFVIVYDGINDVYSAYQQHVAGWPQNEANRFRDFNPSLRQRTGDVLSDYARGLSTRRFLGHFWPFSRLPAFQQAAGSSSAVQTDSVPLDEQLARRVIDVYLTNVEIVKALGERYHFEPLIYWQPTILDKPYLTAYEQRYRTEMEPMEPFFSTAHRIVQERLRERPDALQDLSRVFAKTKAPAYVDYFHLGEVGNGMIATAIVPDVLTLMSAHNATRKLLPGSATQ